MLPRVALSKEFLEAYSRLPRGQQKKVREFTEKFQRNPTGPGIHFEPVRDAIDDKVRSVRIDQAYRAIVIQPPRGDVYLCVWVDHHDEAYAWARKKRFEVNPASGVFQLYELDVPAPEPVAPEVETPAGLFDRFENRELLMAGLPEPLLPAVRALQSDEDLEALAPHLPEDAAEVLFQLAAGYSLGEALEEMERSRVGKEAVDVEDFQEALKQPGSQRGFKVLDDEQDLDAMLEAPLEQWRIFLHPTQRKLVETHANGPMRVLGGAGTGKTVVLMHRAKHLARSEFTSPGDRILVTTFTRNLALDLETNLKNLCGSAFSRLEVTNLHSWAVGFLRSRGQDFRIVQGSERTSCWKQALEGEVSGLPRSFYMDEWDHVIQAQGIESREAYFRASRGGRGTRLSRTRRADVWKVMARYREILDAEGMVEWPDVIREARTCLESADAEPPYCAVLADEVQDFSPEALRLLRALVAPGPNDVFLVGDGHQRIYGRHTPLSRLGFEIRGRRSRRLRLNYRTTQRIRSFAVGLLEGRVIDDLDEGTDSLQGYCSIRTGLQPVIKQLSSAAEENEFIVACVRSWLEKAPPASICVAARSSKQIRNGCKPALEAAGISCVILEKELETEVDPQAVRLATMHRLKGLEFSRVLISGVQKGQVPSAAALRSAPDDAGREDAELQERCLLYVAATRARDELVVVGWGEMSPFLEEIHRASDG